MAHRILLMCGLVAAGCTSTQSLTSQAPSGEVTIDAQVSDWEGALRPVDGENFSLGVLNDQDNLYIALVSQQPQVARQILTRGLTFWLDADGGKERAVGLRFPIGMIGEAQSGGAANSAGSPERMRQLFDQATSHFEIVDGEQVWRHPINSIPNLNANASMEYGTLTLEVRIPLTTNNHFPFAGRAGSTIGLGLETPPVSLSNIGQGAGDRGVRGGGMGGGGFGGGRRSGMGSDMGSGQRPMQQRPNIPEQLKLWTTVTLVR